MRETTLAGLIGVNAGSVDLCTAPEAGLRITVNSNVTFSHNLDEAGLQQNGDTYSTANFESSEQAIVSGSRGQRRQLHPEPGGGLRVNRRLYRSRSDSMLGGVAGGVADYFDMDPSIVRIVWAVLALVTGGIFLVLYIVMWIVVPEGPSAATVARAAPPNATTPGPDEPGSEARPSPSHSPGAAAEAPAPDWETHERRLRRGGSGGAVIFGVILIGLGVWFLIDQYVPDINTDLLWPVALVVLGIVLLVVALRRPSSQ